MPSVKEIEKRSIRITGRNGNRYRLQCLKEDIDNLPKRGLSNGSVCLILDSGDDEASNLIFHQQDFTSDGNWYALKDVSATGVGLKLKYDSDEMIVK